ncbi:hypothetical protein EJ07DRAFT_127160 [Lizonia empirigonia]|nr:hypothetical protein EJ07DRAFT_127160 [Lizonia empirigonia]
MLPNNIYTMSSNDYFQISELQKPARDLRANSEQERTANKCLNDMLESQSWDSSVSTDSRTTRHRVMGSGEPGREITSPLSKHKVKKRNGVRVPSRPLTLRSFPTELNWGGLAVVVYPRVPLSSKIQLPESSMTLWDLVGWLTDRINGNNGHRATEEGAALQNISEWAARIHSHLDADNTQRRIFLVSLIGKQVKLKSGAYMRLIGMHGDEFMVQDTNGVEYIVGKHVELEGVQPHASV